MAPWESSGRRGGICCEADLARIGSDGRVWAADLARLRSSGPRRETAELIDVVRREGVAGATVIDVGAGVGAVHLALLDAGAARAVDVDASQPYLEAAQAEAERRGLGERVEYRYGDVVEIGPELPAAEIVTADSVVCCYPFLERLISALVAPGPRVVGLTYAHDAWWMRGYMRLMNAMWAVRRRPDRYCIHRHATVDRLMRSAGFAVIHDGGTWNWRVVVYRKGPA